MSQDGGSGGAITGGIVGFGSGLADQSNTGVLNVIFQFDFLGDGDAVIDDLGCTEFLLQNHIATLRSESHSDGLGQDVDAFLESATGVLVVDDALCHGRLVLKKLFGLKL
ncbi:MAG: Uncharacterised protein [Synechococcus sp. CC9902]|nr:MAG: Uncharacterised protein [Synechococcus sp. CC9902]